VSASSRWQEGLPGDEGSHPVADGVKAAPHALVKRGPGDRDDFDGSR